MPAAAARQVIAWGSGVLKYLGVAPLSCDSLHFLSGGWFYFLLASYLGSLMSLLVLISADGGTCWPGSPCSSASLLHRLVQWEVPRRCRPAALAHGGVLLIGGTPGRAPLLPGDAREGALPLPRELAHGTVSYTHLTLPTICSV